MKSSDPRALEGSIVGDGGPYERGGVVIDTTNAILLDAEKVAMVDASSGRVGALLLSGRINRSDDRANVLYLFDPDGAAAIVSQLAGLASREGGAFREEFERRLEQRMEEMP